MNTNNILNLLGILTLGYEVLVRIAPTKKNLSILDKIHSVLNFVMPNWKENSTNEIKNKLDKFKNQ